MSDDFNVRKFPEQVKAMQRTRSEGSTQPEDEAEAEATAPVRMYKMVRRLSSTAIAPTDSVRTSAPPPPPVSRTQQPPLLETAESDEENSQHEE